MKDRLNGTNSMNSQLARCAVLVCLAATGTALGQECQPAGVNVNPTSALKQRIDGVALQDESLFDAIARLNEQTDVSFALETIGNGPSHSPKFNISFHGKTLEELLILLTSLDPRFQWKADGHTINIVPRSIVGNERYILNLRLETVNIDHARDAGEALGQALRQAIDRVAAEGRTEKGVLDRMGPTLAFEKPWSVTLHQCTVRQVLNRIAEKLGPAHGWQFSSTPDLGFRQMVFHSRLSRRRDGSQAGENR